MKQPTLFPDVAPTKVILEPVRFDGETYDGELDADRLGAQCRKVFGVMRDGQWRTLQRISEQSGAPEASVSARLRDFRKPRFGGYEVERRRVSDGSGLWEYRLL